MKTAVQPQVFISIVNCNISVPYVFLCEVLLCCSRKYPYLPHRRRFGLNRPAPQEIPF